MGGNGRSTSGIRGRGQSEGILYSKSRWYRRRERKIGSGKAVMSYCFETDCKIDQMGGC